MGALLLLIIIKRRSKKRFKEGCLFLGGIMEDLIKRFAKVEVANPQTIDVFESLRLKILDLADYIDRKIPDSREKSLALTKLEEALMWANCAVSRHLPSD